MDCKIKLKGFDGLLDKTEFDTYQEFTQEINTLKEKPILYSQGKNKFRGKIKNITADLRLEIQLEGSSRNILSVPTKLELNEANKPSEIEPSPTVTPTFEAEHTEPQFEDREFDEDPVIEINQEPEVIKWEQYQSTTTQDLISEKNGKKIPFKERDEFKDDQLNEDQRAFLPEMQSGDFVLVGVQDGPDIQTRREGVQSTFTNADLRGTDTSKVIENWQEDDKISWIEEGRTRTGIYKGTKIVDQDGKPWGILGILADTRNSITNHTLVDRRTYGQVLLLVPKSQLNKLTDRKSVIDASVKINNRHVPYNFEGSLEGPSRTFFGETEGADRTAATHAKRIEIRHSRLLKEGIDISREEVAELFEKEYRELQEDRQKIKDGQVIIYDVTKVSEGHYKPSDKNLDQLSRENPIYTPSNVRVHLEGPMKGRVTAEVDGKEFQVLPVQFTAEEQEMLISMAERTLLPQEELYLKLILGDSRKAYHFHNNKLYYKGEVATKSHLAGDLLTRRKFIPLDLVRQYNNNPNNVLEVVVPVSDPRKGTFNEPTIQMTTVEDYFLSNTTLGLEFYKLKGKVVSDPANRYVYFNKRNKEIKLDGITTIEIKPLREKIQPFLKEYGENLEYKEVDLGHKVLDTQGNVRFIVDTSNPARMDLVDGKVTIYFLKGSGDSVLLEEELHALTGIGLFQLIHENPDHPLLKELERLLAKARNHYNKNKVNDELIHYSLYGHKTKKPSNSQEALEAKLEFLARGLSDERTRNFLRQIQDEKTILDGLRDLVVKVLKHLGILIEPTVYGGLVKLNAEIIAEMDFDYFKEVTEPYIATEETTKDIESPESQDTSLDIDPLDNLFDGIDIDINLGSPGEFTAQDRVEIAQTLDYLFINLIYENSEYTLYDLYNAKRENLEKTLLSFKVALNKLRIKKRDAGQSPELVQFLRLYVDPNTHLLYKNIWLEHSELFNAEIKEDTDELIQELKDQGTLSGRDFSYDGNEINHLKYSNSVTKLLFKSIEMREEGKPVLGKFGTFKLADYKKLFYNTLKLTQGSSTINEMLDRMSNSADPQIRSIIKKLPVRLGDKGWEIKPGIAGEINRNEQFVLKVFQDLRKPDLDYYTLKRFEDADGNKYEFLLELNSKTNKIKESFFTKLRTKNSPHFQLDEYNQPRAKESLLPAAKKELDNKNWKGFFDLLGITFNQKTYEDPEFQKALAELDPLRTKLYNHLEVLVKNGLTDPYRQLSNDFKRSKGFHSRLSKLVDVESKYSTLTANFTIRNAAGNLIQGNSLPNSMTFLLQEINKLTLEEYENLNQIQPGEEGYAKKRLLGNIFSTAFKYSRTKKKIFNRHRRDIEFLAYGGLNQDENLITADLSTSEWLKMQINTTLKEGTSEIMRPETLTSAWAWRIKGMNRNELWVSGKKDFYDQMKEYLKGELIRVSIAQNMPDFKYYNKGLSLFKGLITLDDSTLETIKSLSPEQIEQYVEDNYSTFQPQIEDWYNEEFNKLKGYTQNLSPNDIDVGIRNQYRDGEHLLDTFLMNDIIYNIETSIVLYGGVEWYKDFHKRAKGILSTGQIAPIDELYWNSRTRENTLTGLYGHTDPFSWRLNTALLQEDIAKSTFAEEIETQAIDSYQKRMKAIGIKMTKDQVKERLGDKITNYNKMEIGDGQGWCTIDFYREFLNSVGNWNDELELLYKREVAFFKKFEKGLTLTEEEEALLATKPSTNFTSLKVSYFGTTDAYADINPQIFDKFSLSPLVPSAIYGKKLSHLNHRMLESDISYTKMTSGSKAAQRKDGDGPLSPAPFFDNERNVVIPSLETYSYEIYLPYLKEQIKTDSKVKKKTITSTQKRKLLVSDLNEFGVWIDFDWSPKKVADYHGIHHTSFGKLPKAKKFELIRAYQQSLEPTPLAKNYERYKNIIKEKTNLIKLELFEELGIEEANGKLKIKSVKFFLEALQKELQTRDLNNAVKDFLDLKIKEDIPFEVSTNKQSLQNLIQGLINKRLVRQKLNGSQLIQVAPTGYEALGSTLGLYKPYTPTGKEKTFPNNARYGVKSNWQTKAGNPNRLVEKSGATSTDEAIRLGLRTGTSRSSTQNVKVGEIINVGKTGTPLYARVTKVYTKSLKELIDSGEMTPAQWSEREGWNEGYIADNPQVLAKFPIDFELINLEKTGVTGLKFYTLKDGKTQAAETKVGMVGKWEPLLKRKDVKQKAEAEGITRLEALNKLIKDEAWLEKNSKLITYTGERIPVQGLNSMEYFIVEEFLPSTVGPIIIPPAELVIKSGGDYDIDKETIQIPTFNESGELITSYEKFTSKDAKELSHWREESQRLRRELDKIEETNLQEDYNKINELEKKYTDFVKEYGPSLELRILIDQEIEKIEEKIRPLIEKNKPFQELKDLLFRVNRERRRLEEKKFNHFAYLDNQLLEVTGNFLSHELNYHQLVTPNATDRLSKHLREIGRNLHDAQEDPKNSDIIKTTTNIAKRKSLLTNPRLLGIVAVSNTFLQQYNSINAVINKLSGLGPIDNLLLTEEEKNEISGEEVWYLASQLDFNGILKSEIGSQTINATVDGAREDYLGDANYTMHNMGMIMYLHLWGVPVERIANFINQPVIYEYYKLTELTNQDVRKEYATKFLGLFPGDYYLTQRNALLTSLFRQIAFGGGEGVNLRSIKNYLRKKEELTPLEQKVLDSFDGNKLKKNIDLEQIWKRDLILDTPNFDATKSRKAMLEDPELQIITLVHYLNLIDQAGAIFNIQSRHNYDTNMSQSPLHAREKRKLDETIEAQDFMPPGTIKDLKQTMTSSFNIQTIIEDVFEQVFEFNFPNYFVESAVDTPLKDNTSSLKERFYRTVSNDLIEWVIKRRATVKDEQLGPYINNLLINFNKVYSEKVKDPRIADLAIIQNMLLKPIGNKTYFYLLQDSGSVVEQNVYIENLETLNSIDPEFTRDLVLLGFGQTGFNKTYFSWSDLIPPSLIKDILLPAFSRPLSNEEINEFMDEFRKNNPIFFNKSSKKPMLEAKYITEKKVSIDRTYRGYLNRINMPSNGVFVFGSNPVGINGNPKNNTGGAALVAHTQFGVKQGEKMNNRMSDSGQAYGLVTVKYPGRKQSLTLEEIRENIEQLYEVAHQNPEKKFFIAYDGLDPEKVSLNGYSARQIASQFYGAPENLVFEESFFELIPSFPTREDKFTWARTSTNGYEVSSQGDKRFSALNAKLKDGRTIEEAYQLDVKGYRVQGNDWKLGKGKAPLNPMSFEESYNEYKALWQQWARENPELIEDLKQKASGKVLTDKFAKTNINQARALSEILNQTSSPQKALLKESTLAFRGKKIENQDIVTNEGEVGGAKTDYENNIIRVNYDRLWSIYNRKGWTNPRTLSDKTKAEPLDLNQFQSYEEWLTFVILHEYHHFGNPRLEGETLGEYETRVNKLALEDLYHNFNTEPSPVKDLRVEVSEEIGERLKHLMEIASYVNLSQDEEVYENARTGEVYERATHYINKGRPEDSPLLESSQKIGTAVDELVRDYFQGTLRPYEEYKTKAGKWVEEAILFENPALFNSFVKELELLKERFKKNGEQVISNDVRVFDNIKSSFDGVAGTLDILTIDKNGKVRIYDLKTKRSGLDFIHSQTYGKTDFVKWTEQLNLYRIMLYNQTGLLANEINILPIKVYYQEGKGTVTQATFLKDVNIPVVESVREARLNSTDLSLGTIAESKPEDFSYSDYYISDEPFYGSFSEDNKSYEIRPMTEPIDFLEAVQRGYAVQDFNGKKVVHRVVVKGPEVGLHLLDEKLINGFLRDFNITVEEYNDLKSELGLDAYTASDLLTKSIVHQSGESILPEVAYFAYKMLGKKNSKIRSNLRYLIHKWPKYKEVFDKKIAEYSETEGYNRDSDAWRRNIRDLVIIDFLQEHLIDYYLNPKKFEKDMDNKWTKEDFSLWQRIIRAIENFLSRFNVESKRNKLNNIGRSIASEIIDRKYEYFDYELSSDQILKDYEKTLDQDPFAKNLVKQFQGLGFMLTGSLALRKVGTVYRTANESLHDIDWVIPNNLVDQEKADTAIQDYKKNPIFDQTDGIAISEFLFRRVIQDADWFKKVKELYPSFKIVNQFVGSENLSDFSSVTITGVINGEFYSEDGFHMETRKYYKKTPTGAVEVKKEVKKSHKKGDHIQGTGYLIDFFVRMKPNQAEHGGTFKLWKEIMLAKMEMGRDKDFIDWKHYIPIVPSKDRFNFYHKGFRHLNPKASYGMDSFMEVYKNLTIYEEEKVC